LIPFNKPFVPEASKKYAIDALESNHQQGDGLFTKRASKMVSDLVGGGHVLLTPSCTHALEMASMLGNIGPGDEVILPSYTFTSAGTAVTKFGAIPVFVDIEKNTKGIDVNQVRNAITPKTKAISWVNYAGMVPDIEGLQSLAKEFNLLLIEDNAHGLGGSYKGKPLGSFGDFATQSFHATKNIQCGEGGALVINAPQFIERAEIIREKGTDRKKYINKEVQKYQWVDQGSSYLLAETLSAVLLGQLELFDQIQETRNQQIQSYIEFFEERRISSEKAKLANGDLKNSSHMFYVEVSSDKRNHYIEQFHKKVVLTSHYLPLHSSIKGLEFHAGSKVYRESIELSEKILRFPIHSHLDVDATEIKETLKIMEKYF
jgi:dTDP-4-amino-4,6-dideoxygalactose transaminase